MNELKQQEASSALHKVKWTNGKIGTQILPIPLTVCSWAQEWHDQAVLLGD